MSSLALVCQTARGCSSVWNLQKKVHSLHTLSWCKKWTFPDFTWHGKTTETLGLLWAQTPRWALENGDLNPISNFCPLTFRRRVSRFLLRWRVRVRSLGNSPLRGTFYNKLKYFFQMILSSYRNVIFQWTLVFFYSKARQKMGVVYWCLSSYIATVTLAKQPTGSICVVKVNITS